MSGEHVLKYNSIIEFVILAVAVLYRANFEDLSPTTRVHGSAILISLISDQLAIV